MRAQDGPKPMPFLELQTIKLDRLLCSPSSMRVVAKIGPKRPQDGPKWDSRRLQDGLGFKWPQDGLRRVYDGRNVDVAQYVSKNSKSSSNF